MNRSRVCLLVTLLALLGAVRTDEEVTLENSPPVVVSTIPAAGSEDIDPGIAEIKVAFSKDMTDGGWSFVTVSKESFPPTNGQPHYEDRRTCVLPVQLKPGTTYAMWINHAKFDAFKDADGKPAVPYLLVFKTKG